jgi:hypothetical protein
MLQILRELDNVINLGVSDLEVFLFTSVTVFDARLDVVDVQKIPEHNAGPTKE